MIHRIGMTHFGDPRRPNAQGRVSLAHRATGMLSIVLGLAAAYLPAARAADRLDATIAATGNPPTADVGCPALLRQTFNRLQTGEPQSLCQFQGKVLLVVNTASYCGFTSQYEGLEAIYRKYKDRGLVVVGFPSNDFSQEPGSNKEIAEFCRTTYGVEFPQFEKSSVSRLAANPLYAELARQTGRKPEWNFYKFVIDRSGKPIATFGSTTVPESRELTMLIERLLAEKPGSAQG
jgi:glutathione peroxidase